MRVRAVMVLLPMIIPLLASGAMAAEKPRARTAGGPAAVSGTVHDASGRPVGQARLVLQTNDGGILGRTVTDKSGHFTFKHVAPGNYLVVANHDGFETAASTVTVTTGGAPPLVIALEAETALTSPSRTGGWKQPPVVFVAAESRLVRMPRS
jgi:hypothetical protein